MRAGWRAVLLALLVTLSWQSFLTQTHRHFDPGAVAAGAQYAAGQPRDQQSPFDQPANCPICREVAHAGHAVLPTPVQIAAPAPVTFWLTVARPLGLTLVQRSHAWRSRAPPHQLQA